MNQELPDVQAEFQNETRTSRCTSWVSKRQRKQRSNCQHSLDHGEGRVVPEKYLHLCFTDYAKTFDCRSQQTMENS